MITRAAAEVSACNRPVNTAASACPVSRSTNARAPAPILSGSSPRSDNSRVAACSDQHSLQAASSACAPFSDTNPAFSPAAICRSTPRAGDAARKASDCANNSRSKR